MEKACRSPSHQLSNESSSVVWMGLGAASPFCSRRTESCLCVSKMVGEGGWDMFDCIQEPRSSSVYLQCYT